MKFSNAFQSFLFFSFTFFFCSCNQIRVITSVPYPKTEKIKNIALLPVIIGKIDQPLFPLIDAGIFNAKTDKIAQEITDEESKIIESFRDSLARNLSNNLKINVLYGDELYRTAGYESIQDFPASLDTEDEEFPRLLISKKEKMPFLCKKGNLPKAIISEENKERIGTICETLGVDAIGVGYLKLSVLSASSFGISGTLATSIRVYIIYKNGKILSEGHIMGKNVSISGKKLIDYTQKLNEFPMLTEIIVKDLTGQKYKAKK